MYLSPKCKNRLVQEGDSDSPVSETRAHHHGSWTIGSQPPASSHGPHSFNTVNKKVIA